MSSTPWMDSPHGSDWSTASQAGQGPSSSASRQLARVSETTKPTLSLLKQQVLTEDEYTEGVSDIIKRTFFPQLRELDAHNQLVAAFESEDPAAIEASVRRMREICTPTPRRRNKGATPGRTPFGTEPSSTPTYFSETPSSTSRATPRSHSTTSRTLRYDPTLSLSAFQSTYTSEDNSSFASLLAKDNLDRKEKSKWAWEAERRANVKAVRGREARERLVDVTREMVESDPGGVVRMVMGAPGRPGERKLVVQGKVGGGGVGRLMVEGRTDGKGRLMIMEGEGAVGRVDGGKEEVEGEGFVDWDKPTVEEDEAAKEVAEDETQVPMEGWTFTNRNSLMFPPDANGPVALSSSSTTTNATDTDSDGLPLGEPKGIRYHATRLDHVEKRAPGAPSPSRSRIHAAISGTPYPSSSSRPSSTPKVAGFSFVDALPTPRASTIDPKDLQELMTWGSIASTPIALRSTGSSARSSLSSGGGPFHISDTSRREALAHKMANKAKRSLADRDRGHSSSHSTGGLRRTVLESSRGGGMTPRGTDLSPAARSLLKKTGQGRAYEKGMKESPGWKDKEEERRARTRALVRAREVESREVLRRTTWEVSPGPETAFEPDMPTDAIRQ